MKKTYITPEINMVKVNLQQMFASSPIGSNVYGDTQAGEGSYGLTKREAWEDIWDDGSEETEYDY